MDGKQVKLLLTDYTFRSVAVPKGEHDVEFIYVPKFSVIGLKIAALGLLAVLAIIFIIRKYEK